MPHRGGGGSFWFQGGSDLLGRGLAQIEAADDLADEFEATKAKLGDTAKSDEDVLSYIAFPQVAEKFFEERRKSEENTFVYSIRRID